MNNQIVKFTDERGQLVQFTGEDVRNTLCPNADAKEIALFLELCKSQRLNPFIKDAYLVKYGNAPASMITGKEVFTKRANRNPNYEGMEAGVVVASKGPQGVHVERREGAAVYTEIGEKLIGGWARVYVKGKRPVYAELALAEYSTGKSNWSKMPAVMINKCAQVAALRLAFPEEFQGMYAAEEMGQAGEYAAAQQVQQPAPVVQTEPEPVELMTEAQGAMLQELCEKFAALRGKAPSEVYEALMGCKAMHNAGARLDEVMTTQQADTAAAVLMGWIEKAQAMKPEPEPVEAEIVEAEPIAW